MDDRHEAGKPGLPADFIPLRLVLRATGASVELTRVDMVLGRHSEADIRLPLPDVSRRHCRFFFDRGAWHVQDLKSLNGTHLNDQPIQEALLCNGDRLRIGGFVFNVDLASVKKPAGDGVILSITHVLPAGPTEDKSSRQAG
jgi:pSer/pThr/pTyr-binding forkhead associated (FHA) protein